MQPRETGLRYDTDHLGDDFFSIITNADGAVESKLMYCNVTDSCAKEDWIEILPYNDTMKIGKVKLHVCYVIRSAYYVFIRMCVYVWLYVYVNVWLYVCLNVHVWFYLCKCTLMYVCTYVWPYMYGHVRIYGCMYVSVYMCPFPFLPCRPR